MNREPSDYSIVEIGYNTDKGPGDLRRLAVTQTPVKDYQQKMAWKNFLAYCNNNNNNNNDNNNNNNNKSDTSLNRRPWNRQKNQEMRLATREIGEGLRPSRP